MHKAVPDKYKSTINVVHSQDGVRGDSWCHWCAKPVHTAHAIEVRAPREGMYSLLTLCCQCYALWMYRPTSADEWSGLVTGGNN